MMTDRGIASEIGDRFDHVLVDEYRDTNRLQASILLALKPSGSGLTVVGDDAQTIYSFRAATVRNILDFPKQFSPPAEIVTLDKNYRSTQPILTAANALIELANERYTKNLWTDRTVGELPQLVWVRDEADQVSYVVERVLENHETGLTLKQQAVLFRASHHSGPLEVELTRRNIPSSSSAGSNSSMLPTSKISLLCCGLSRIPGIGSRGFGCFSWCKGSAQAQHSACSNT